MESALSIMVISFVLFEVLIAVAMKIPVLYDAMTIGQ